MKSIQNHFSRIAPRYRNLRTTDREITSFIKKKLQKFSKIEAADVGCGAGRYGLKLFQGLGNRLYLHCIDCDKEMLKNLNLLLTKHKIKNYRTVKTFSGRLLIKDNSLDCLFTFNAVHHFKILDFLKEATRVLKNKGYLFIYTRSRTQNSRNIWGQYFPLFNKKETRLYELDELKRILKKVPGLKLNSIKLFKYKRKSNINRLVKQAQHHHYSTFSLYNKEEFKESLGKFKQNLQQNFKDLKNITWFDENILLIIRKL